MSESKTTEHTGQIKRYVHQPLRVTHYGITASIQENGTIVLSNHTNGNEEYDEIEIPASLVFRLATLLKATRSITFVSTSINQQNNNVTQQNESHNKTT